jgi:hypothetical protein
MRKTKDTPVSPKIEPAVGDLKFWERLNRSRKGEKLWPADPGPGQILVDDKEMWAVADPDLHEWRLELRSRGGFGQFHAPCNFKFLTAEQRRIAPPKTGAMLVLAFELSDSSDPTYSECRQLWPYVAKFVSDKVHSSWKSRSDGIINALNILKHAWPKPDLISNQQILKGLFGELYLLNWFLENGVSADTALNRWVGPDKEVHDFHFQRCHVEVKANSSKNRRVIITDLRQLDESRASEGVLFLAYIELNKTGEKENSLPALREKIEKRLNESQKQLLSIKLWNARWTQLEPLARQKTIFRVNGPEFFAVIDGFPRLLRKDIQNLKNRDVTVLRYRITVPHPGEYSILGEKLLSNIR